MGSASRLVRIAAAGVSALALAGCATLTVNSYADRAADFARYRTFAWGPEEQLSTGDPRLDNNPFFHERVQAQIEKQLAARGLEKATSGGADLTVHYHTSITQEIQAGTADRQYGYCEGEGCLPYVYDAGTLLIDLVDTRSNRVIWRGWAKGSVDGVIENQDWMEERIDQAVARIMERFPARI
jgi:hypothetical protein